MLSRLRRRRTQAPAPTSLPPPARLDLDRPARELWLERIEHVLRDSYVGVPLWKLAEDLRTYEHLLWLARPDAVIEIGASGGGSALWFRDRLRTLAAYGAAAAEPRVISIDLDVSGAGERLAAVDPDFADTIALVAGDVTDPELPERVRDLLPPGAGCLVIEDSAHLYETTAAALRGFSSFVPPGGFFVVEDGCVDVEEMRLPGWPRGVLPAIRDWLGTEDGSRFRVRRDLELYGMSSNPGGYLQRVGA